METINGVKIDWGKEYGCAKPDKLTQLIDDHWNYINALLETYNLSERDRQIAKFQYTSAFRHGYKHAKEEYDRPNKA